MKNREIKFRCWDGENIISPEYINRDGIGFWNENSIPTCSKKIMQYIGLKDRNGVEIYEGDIVRWGLNFSGTGYDSEVWHRYAVVSFNPDIEFKIIYYVDSKTMERMPCDDYSFKFGTFAYKETHKYLEVIGNIHQNKNLIKNK